MWRSEDNSQESGLSYAMWGSEIQLKSSDSMFKPLYPLSHLTSLTLGSQERVWESLVAEEERLGLSPSFTTSCVCYSEPRDLTPLSLIFPTCKQGCHPSVEVCSDTDQKVIKGYTVCKLGRILGIPSFCLCPPRTHWNLTETRIRVKNNLRAPVTQVRLPQFATYSQSASVGVRKRHKC